MDLTEREIERFWAKVRKSDACWVWTASVRAGYGYIQVAGSKLSAHRISYTLAYGAIPEGDGYHGTCVCHTCDNRLCVRPDHLFLGSNADNAADRSAKGRTPRRYGESNPRCKFGPEIRDRIFALKARGVMQKTIARLTGVSEPQVSLILNGKSRCHV